MAKDRKFGDRGTGYTPRKKRNLEGVLNGVKDVVIIQLLFKNMNYIYADVVLEKWQIHWDSKKMGKENGNK